MIGTRLRAGLQFSYKLTCTGSRNSYLNRCNSGKSYLFLLSGKGALKSGSNHSDPLCPRSPSGKLEDCDRTVEQEELLVWHDLVSLRGKTVQEHWDLPVYGVS